MIPVSHKKVHANSWQAELRVAYISVTKLLDFLNLSHSDFGLLDNPEFKLKVPPSFFNKIKPGDPDDPLLLQILPKAIELEKSTGFSDDPLEERKFNQISGLIKKYNGRALLMASAICPLHCRYCFRKNFSYQDNLRIEPALAALMLDKSIKEVILSGGDPLSLGNSKLDDLLAKIADIPHVEILRIHTRFPIAIASRLDAGLLNILARSRLKIVLVSHANHPNEIDEKLIEQLKPFRGTVMLLNQSVLLKDINDSHEVQIRLAYKLFAAGIMPYYLHLLDKVQGTAHFKVKKSAALKILQRMQVELPGYLVPKLVFEEPGKTGKTRLL